MANKINYVWWIIGALILTSFTMVTYQSILQQFFVTWESFSATPYWDYKQWSWGYGTRVPGSVNDRNINPGGTITRDQAMKDALHHVQLDYDYLKKIITRSLNANQWSALLSFSYNAGSGNADNLANNINSYQDAALEDQWKKYIYAGGEINQGLINRRNAEWQLWQS